MKKYRLLLFKPFARSSDQDSSQQQRLEEAEQPVEVEPPESEDTTETVTVIGYQRSKNGREPLHETVLRTEYVRGIDESQK